MNSSPVRKSRKNTRGPRRPKQQRNAVLKIERMEHPPQIQGYQIDHKVRLRFTCTAAANGTAITYANLLDAILIATTAVQGVDLFDIVRVRSVEVWSQAAIGTPSTNTVIFATPNFGDRSIHTDTSLGVKPAYIKAVPSGRSLAAFFQVSAAGNCFQITCPTGSVVDILCTYRVTNTAVQFAANALVGATVGELYYRGLDGMAIAATNFPPIAGVTQI